MTEGFTRREKRIRFVAVYVLMDNGIDRDVAWFDAYLTFPPIGEMPSNNRQYRKRLSRAAKSHAKQTRRLVTDPETSTETIEALARRTLEQYEAIADEYGDDFIPDWTASMLRGFEEERHSD